MTKLPESARKKLLAWIDSSGLSTRGVVVDLNGTSIKLREPRACFQDADYVVVAIETEKVKSAGINYKQVTGEAGLSLINCSAAVIAGVVTFGSTAASPFTGGTSLAISASGYAATVATGVSCAASVYRTYNALTDPKANHILDNSPAYQTTMKVVDGISLLGVGTSAVAAVKAMNILIKSGSECANGSHRNGKSPSESQAGKRIHKSEQTWNFQWGA
ncbi:hypothetical protein [Candidatus Thiosymbion oneisti]|uniref:hypothetical protein n=1 Tax=Candidatus Thiosymbion oneisti TaxID=589554 RepID=UPI00106025FC|nr:hypothetical protein [Candidatus Thiosymbion oneisti]